MDKKDKRNILIMILLILVLGIFFLLSTYLFGSKTDWLGQHTAFPEYFRNLFYQTKKIFPSFALNLGSGQNIFHFSYYGLFHPIFLFSYFLPFISMTDYIIVTSLLSILVSMILLYYFLKRKLNQEIALFSCLLYFFACPIIFHAHRHIMFVNYMPFLIFGLIGVDKYFEKEKNFYLTISVLLMILTSYYYSIGGIVTIIIYGIYRWLQMNEFRIKKFLQDGMKFMLPILFGILLSAFFLFPTAYSLLNGRESGSDKIRIWSLLVPNFNIKEILYTSYSLGLTSIFLLAILYFITSKKHEMKLLSFVFFLVCFLPIIVYLLNGTLYVRTKVLIPFLPLAIYLIGYFIKEILDKKSLSKIFWILFMIFQIGVLVNHSYTVLYWLDILIMIFAIWGVYKWNQKWIIYIPVILISIISCIAVNIQEGYVKKSYSIETTKKLVENIPITNNLWRTSIQTNTLYGINQIYSPYHYSTSLYSSVYNEFYAQIFMKTFQKSLPYRNRLILATTNNLPFQILMSERYMIADCHKDYIGYHKLLQQGTSCLFENNDVYPIGYGSNQLISEATFSQMPYPTNIETILQSIIVPDDIDASISIESQLKPMVLSSKKLNIGEHIVFQKTLDGYLIDVKQKDTIHYELEHPLSNQLLWLDFEVVEEPSCQEGDLGITINDITNKLTCSSWQYKNENHRFAYIISEKKLQNLEIVLSKGKYQLRDIHIYTIDYDALKQSALYPFIVDMEQTKADKVIGDITMEQDGYFVLSVPYDKGFKIKVDGFSIQYEKVNTSFLGFPLKKGTHHIELLYEAPYYKLGKIVSLITLIVCIGYYYYRMKHRI